MWLLPPMRSHVDPDARPRPLGQLRAIFGVANHRWAFALMIALMFAGFTVIPFIAPYNVANVGISEADLAVIYFVGGLATLVTSQVIGWLADRRGKRRVFTAIALSRKRCWITTPYFVPDEPMIAAIVSMPRIACAPRVTTPRSSAWGRRRRRCSRATSPA